MRVPDIHVSGIHVIDVPDMRRSGNNFAFIDAQNVHLGIKAQGWLLDFRRFRKYLEDKHGVRRAFLFIGSAPGREGFYSFLRRIGYVCVLKPTLRLPGGQMKGNVDAELVLHTMIELPNFERAVIVSGDGDFRCLIEYLKSRGKLEKVIIPNGRRYSALLKALSSPENDILEFMDSLRKKVGRSIFRENEKGSQRDGTLREPLSS